MYEILDDLNNPTLFKRRSPVPASKYVKSSGGKFSRANHPLSPILSSDHLVLAVRTGRDMPYVRFQARRISRLLESKNRSEALT